MEEQQDKYIKMSKSSQLLPQEEVLLQKHDSKRFSIGIPKEIVFQEKRVALVPSAVALLVNNDHDVYIEKNAGANASFPDKQYVDAGATIVSSAHEIYQCDVVMKVAPATLSEISLMKNRLVLISALHDRIAEKTYYKALIQKKITALSYEHIGNNTDEHPILHTISEMVGSTTVLIASHYLADNKWGRGKMLGGFTGINPSEIVIIGAGTIAESAAKAAIGLGAMVKVFDNCISNLRRLQNNIGTTIFTSIIQPDVLSTALKTADVAIGALYDKNGDSAPVVTEYMVENMKSGAIIIDASIDRGGCFATSEVTNHLEPVYKKHDVTHYCVPNISSRTPHSASYALSNYFATLVIRMADSGGLNQLITEDDGLRKGVYMYNGKLTFSKIANKFGMQFQDLSLLLAAFR